jgi:hypothetical protein
VPLVGFLIWNLSQCTVTWTSVSPHMNDISVLPYYHGVRAKTRIKIKILKCIKNIIHYLNCDTCSSRVEILWLFSKNNIECRGVLSMYLVITLIPSSHLVTVVRTYK